MYVNKAYVCIYILNVKVTVPVLDLKIIVTNTKNFLYKLKTNQEAEKSARRIFSDILNKCKKNSGHEPCLNKRNCELCILLINLLH